MYRDHLCSTAFEALTAAADRAGQLEGGQPADADWGPPEEAAARQAVATRAAEQRRRRQAEEARRPRAARRRWQQRLQAQQSGSLQEVLIAG